MTRALLAGLPAVVLLAASARPPQAGGSGPEASHLLYPSANASTPTGRLVVVAVTPATARGPGVTLDGRPLRLERLSLADGWWPRAIRRSAQPERPALLDDPGSAALWRGVIAISPGEHTLRAGGRAVRITRATRAGQPHLRRPAPPWRPHSPAATGSCGACHKASGEPGARAIGAATTPDACRGCHPDAEMQARHRHVMDILARCWTCHDPHGSTSVHLLTDSRRTLCTRCHAEGHSKG